MSLEQLHPKETITERNWAYQRAEKTAKGEEGKLMRKIQGAENLNTASFATMIAIAGVRALLGKYYPELADSADVVGGLLLLQAASVVSAGGATVAATVRHQRWFKNFGRERIQKGREI